MALFSEKPNLYIPQKILRGSVEPVATPEINEKT